VHGGKYYVNSQLPTSNSQMESGRITLPRQRSCWRE
jgi:hypothetical protein